MAGGVHGEALLLCYNCHDDALWRASPCFSQTSLYRRPMRRPSPTSACSNARGGRALWLPDSNSWITRTPRMVSPFILVRPPPAQGRSVFASLESSATFGAPSFLGDLDPSGCFRRTRLISRIAVQFTIRSRLSPATERYQEDFLASVPKGTLRALSRP